MWVNLGSRDIFHEHIEVNVGQRKEATRKHFTLFNEPGEGLPFPVLGNLRNVLGEIVFRKTDQCNGNQKLQ